MVKPFPQQLAEEGLLRGFLFVLMCTAISGTAVAVLVFT